MATATLVVGSNLPDIDIFGQAFADGGNAYYLIHHRGITHGLLGIAVQVGLLAAVMYGIGRLVRAGPRFRPLLAAAAVGLVAHPLLDLLNTYGIRPWLPFDGTWYYGDMAFIVDPWLWLMFGAAACLGAPRTRRSAVGWIAFGVLSTAVVAHHAGGRVPTGVLVVWLAGIGLVVGSRALRVGSDGPRIPRAMLGLALCYLVALGVNSRIAETRGLAWLEREIPGLDVVASSVHPDPAVPWGWEVLAETPDEIHRVALDLRSGRISRRPSMDKGLDDPAIEAVKDTLEYRAWQTFARHKFCCRYEGRLLLGDARYSRSPVPNWCNVEVPLR